MTTHTNERKFECPFPGCNKKFKRKDHLQNHMETHKEDREKKYSCPYEGCNKKYFRKEKLTRHINNVHKKEKYQCDFPGCQARFVKKNQLIRHKAIHTGKKPYQCTYEGCGMCFDYPSQLKRHIRSVHTKEKTHICGECGLSFLKFNELQRHIKEFHALQYECDVCGKKFNSKRNLKNHSQVHELNRKVYVCNHKDCNSSFATLSSLNAHINAVHKGIRYKCLFCGKLFSYLSTLSLHKKKFHDLELKENDKNEPKYEIIQIDENQEKDKHKHKKEKDKDKHKNKHKDKDKDKHKHKHKKDKKDKKDKKQKR
ncbi:zinc finger protein [Anaeramoeba ignava]|uniref:Zinc finger protein n=1 Tax=Anaeramoeba ignava TaxID=1746090 RepID=A0A9Q0L6G8_ANAIG|nr:zinc finger protein [Anaeramoeba ignava]